MDWPTAIVELAKIKSRIFDYDNGTLMEYTWPRAPVQKNQLIDFQKSIGRPLPAEYNNFLLYANGWHSLLSSTDLFSVEDFTNNIYQNHVKDVFFEIDDIEIKGFAKEDLLPIGCNLFDTDVFLMSLADNDLFGSVICVAGYEIDRYENFDVFFASMILYNQNMLEEIQAGGYKL